MITWPLLAVAAALLQLVRNASQRSLTQQLGIGGATYVRFLFGLPFALAWAGAVWLVREPALPGGPSWAFLGWTLLGGSTQVVATGALVLAMRSRAFAVATALLKTEILASALVGMVLLGDLLSTSDWWGAAIGTLGVLLLAHVSVDRSALSAAAAGAASGVIFAFSSVAYRGATQAWGGDPWIAAATALVTTLVLQTVGGALVLAIGAPGTLRRVITAWRPSLTPGAAGAISSSLLFTAFALGPSVAAIKTVQLVDVLIAWVVSRHLFRERVDPWELTGALLVVAGAVAVLL